MIEWLESYDNQYPILRQEPIDSHDEGQWLSLWNPVVVFLLSTREPEGGHNLKRRHET